jgi:hypothetical protein
MEDERRSRPVIFDRRFRRVLIDRFPFDARLRQERCRKPHCLAEIPKELTFVPLRARFSGGDREYRKQYGPKRAPTELIRVNDSCR